MARKPNFLVILIDDLRYDEFGAGGHPYMKTPNIDRIAHEGALFERVFHTTPICSPNRASILSGQYASRHGIIDNVARDLASHRLPNYHLELQKLGYETAHIGKWHMGNDGKPRPGYDRWVSFDGHGRLSDPNLNVDGTYERRSGYITDLLNEEALSFLSRSRSKPFSLFLAHKAVHPDAEQAADGTIKLSGYLPAERHRDLYKGKVVPYHDTDAAGKEMNSLDFMDATTQTVRGAVQYLSRNGAKVGLTGFCLGGAVTIIGATKIPELAAGVVFYGRVPPPAAVPNIHAPLLLNYAGLDQRINADLPAYEQALRAAGKRYTLHMYEGANHAFHNDTSAARYDPEAARLAWERTVAFFRENLA